MTKLRSTQMPNLGIDVIGGQRIVLLQEIGAGFISIYGSLQVVLLRDRYTSDTWMLVGLTEEPADLL